MRSILRPAALIETWFDNLRPEQRDLARILRALVQDASSELVQTVKWGNLMFTHEGTHAVAIVMHKDHANLQIFNGASLSDQFPELEGTGRGMRHIRFRYRYPVDEDLVREVVQACVDLMALSPRTGPGALTEEH
ncbi:DUF1801 domain-containing protein [Piscinibacter terrae]|jgi:hypothetical protein|uniref:DUF1801 domain-containing protein n=1 Tax=Piscinibacter terrae TaxID=2496871 RepID=A0A3N7K5L9_9BURK|nr:DUF1801 domain-containing protein [Albitalea terrae]RQP26215.1 DUF1801 domain-containing protein [Albitalea terrae]